MDKETKLLLKKFEQCGSLSVKGTIRRWCGDLISRGLNRDVYVLKYNPKWVVKIQRTVHFDNVVEYKIWDAVRFAPADSKWFAECLTISETGLVLIQRRIEHKSISEYPKKVPYYFTDFKIQNYGWVGDRFVCCDYANVLDMLTGKMTQKTRTAKWWEAGVHRSKRKKDISIQTEL